MPNQEMLLIPGPTPVVDEIYEALAQETYAHTDPRLVKRFKNSLDMLKRLFNTKGEAFIVAGSGTLSMEMAIVNTVAPGEKLLVISHGFLAIALSPLPRPMAFRWKYYNQNGDNTSRFLP